MLDRSAYRYCKRAGFSNKDVSWNFRDWTLKLRQWLWNELTTAQKGCLGQKIHHYKGFYEQDFECNMES